MPRETVNQLFSSEHYFVIYWFWSWLYFTR